MHLHCPHFKNCAGCTFDENIDNPLVWNEIRQFFTQITLHIGAITKWRHRAKLAVRGSAKKPHIGLFRTHSHQVEPIPHCLVHHPLINQAVHKLASWIAQENIQPYNEATHKGILRYAQFHLPREATKVQLSLVIQEEINTNTLQNDPFWSSIWLNLNTRKDNVIFGPTWKKVSGEDFLIETLCGEPVYFHPATFAQANPEMFERLLKKIMQIIPPQARVLEFYSGVGAIGIPLSSRSAQVDCVEINPFAKLCFSKSQTRARFHEGNATDFTNLIEDADYIIVDPPRKGLEKGLLNALRKGKNLIYISCGWPAFKRDCQELIEQGWYIEESEAYLFFPGSDHIELLVYFRKSG